MKDVREVLEQDIKATIPELTIMWRLQPDYLEQLPVCHLVRDGGPDSFIERVDRLTVDIFDDDDAGGLAEKVKRELTKGPHFVEGLGLIDGVACSSLPHNIPFADPSVEQNTAEYQVTTRLDQFEE